MPTFAHDPDSVILGKLNVEWDDPRMDDVLGSEGVIDDEHVAGQQAHFGADQPHAVQEIQEGVVALRMTVHRTQLIRHVSHLVAPHEAQEPPRPRVEPADDDPSRTAGGERVLDAHGPEPLHRRPRSLSRPHLPLLSDQLRKFRDATHAHAQINSAGIRSDHPESARHRFTLVVVARVVDDHVVHVDVVLLVSEDLSSVLKVVLRQVDAIHLHEVEKRFVDAADEHPSAWTRMGCKHLTWSLIAFVSM